MPVECRRMSRVVTFLLLVLALALPLTLGVPGQVEAAQAYGLYVMWFLPYYQNGQEFWYQVGEEGTYCDGTRYSWGQSTPHYQRGDHCTEW